MTKHLKLNKLFGFIFDMVEIDYIVGTPDDFHAFVDDIGLHDRVAVLTHTDLDGVASAIFLEKILEAKGIKVDFLEFLDIERDMFKKILIKLKEERITRVFITDINADQADLEGFNELRRQIGTFLIDHHPISEELTDKTNVIKTDSRDCVAITLFSLGKDLIDENEYRWLNLAAIFSDYCFLSQKNMNYFREFYPNTTKENISSTTPGINARRISSALIYYDGDVKYVYRLVKEKDIDELDKSMKIIEDEVEKITDDFLKNSEYYENLDLYFYEVDSEFGVTSYVASWISKVNPDINYIFMKRRDGYCKFSARSTGEKMDMGKLMNFLTKGLEGANGGGHRAAAGGRIRADDLREFKRRLREYSSSVVK